jgi:hypothetical protein
MQRERSRYVADVFSWLVRTALGLGPERTTNDVVN